jgi:hypothetical protein
MSYKYNKHQPYITSAYNQISPIRIVTGKSPIRPGFFPRGTKNNSSMIFFVLVFLLSSKSPARTPR